VRIGLFGGTFDPPHAGHLALAEWARERLRLDEVVFMPAGRPPHKRGRRVSPAADRLAMTRRAVRGFPAFRVSSHEARRAGPSFTVDTLRALRRQHPGARLFLLMGADSLDEFHTWRDPAGIAALATLVVAARPGERAPARAAHGRRTPAPRPVPGRRGAPAAARVVWLDNPGLAISSSMLRRRAAAGRTLRVLVPDAVSAYVRRRRLYRAGR
jgi:nicotinate-nucleotide adenylyltransferase